MENKYYNEEDFLQLSGIQHFSFCRRQWALIHIEQIWHENVLTAEGRVEHDRVHNGKIHDQRKGILTIRNLPVKSYVLGISGNCDAVEFTPCEDGVTLKGKPGTWGITPIEYKHGKSKSDDCDRLQVVAQAICLEEMFCCNIEVASIFYLEPRRRENLEITYSLRQKVVETYKEMHRYMIDGYTPKVKVTKACKSCSLENDCMTELLKKNKTVKSYFQEYLGEF